MNGPLAIDWQDIDAFVRRSGTFLSVQDVRLLETIDDAYLAAYNAGAAEADNNQAIRDGLKEAARQ